MLKLDIKLSVVYNPFNQPDGLTIRYDTAITLYQGAPGVGTFSYDITIGALDVPNGVFPSIQDAWDYYYASSASAILAEVNYLTGDLYELGDKTYYDQPIDDAIQLKQDKTDSTTALAALTLSSGKMPYGTGANSMGQVDTLSFGRSLLGVSGINNGVSRTLNSAFQISSTKPAIVNYSVQIAATLSLITGQTGTVSLQVCATSGGTFVEVCRFTNGNTGALAVGLNLTQTLVGVLSAFIPAGYYVKFVTSGTGASTYITGQEIY